MLVYSLVTPQQLELLSPHHQNNLQDCWAVCTTGPLASRPPSHHLTSRHLETFTATLLTLVLYIRHLQVIHLYHQFKIIPSIRFSWPCCVLVQSVCTNSLATVQYCTTVSTDRSRIHTASWADCVYNTPP